MPPHCRDCKSPITFWQTAAGKWRPSNLDGSPHHCTAFVRRLLTGGYGRAAARAAGRIADGLLKRRSRKAASAAASRAFP